MTRNFPWGGGPLRKADNLTAIWEPLRLTPLWAFTACYGDSFTFFFLQILNPRYLCGDTLSLFYEQMDGMTLILQR
jgi:hypothetical protein